MAQASTLHILIQKGVTYEITSPNMSAAHGRGGDEPIQQLWMLLLSSPSRTKPRALLFLPLRSSWEGNSLWRNVKRCIKETKARQWQSRRAGPFRGTLWFILQETMWVFSYPFSTQEQEKDLVAFPSYVSPFLPMPTQLHHRSEGPGFILLFFLNHSP